MDIFFQDPDEIPLPPEEVRIRQLRAEVWPDGRRVRVFLEVDPFQKRPSVELTIQDSDGQMLASASIIESMTRQIELTMHLRGEIQPGWVQLSAVLFYLAPPPEPGQAVEYEPKGKPEIIDQKQISFERSIAEN